MKITLIFYFSERVEYSLYVTPSGSNRRSPGSSRRGCLIISVTDKIYCQDAKKQKYNISFTGFSKTSLNHKIS